MTKGNDPATVAWEKKQLAKQLVRAYDREQRIAGRFIMVDPTTRMDIERASRADLELALTFETIPEARAQVEAALARLEAT